MIQKIIQVGNSLAFTIPKLFVDQTGFKVGDELFVQQDPKNKSLIVTTIDLAGKMKVSPELFSWLDSIEKRYETAIKQLAQR